VIRVEQLNKSFEGTPPTQAVADVSFEVAAGEVYGLLGPNGAGKTTTLRMLATLLRPDSGRVSICNHDLIESPEAVRSSIGYLSGNTGLYGRLTAREMILYFARLQNVSDPKARTEELIDRLDIGSYADQRCDALSTGMAQKVSIARAIAHQPPILIFDEPTSGLDVLVAQTVLEFVEEAKANGSCVLYSTHVMSEAERLCDRIGILHQGSLLAEGSLEELRRLSSEHYLEAAFVHFVRSASE
jgi:sodium transport system ATP-binding protein